VADEQLWRRGEARQPDRPQESSGARASSAPGPTKPVKADRLFILSRRRREDGRKSAHGKGTPAEKSCPTWRPGPWPRPFFSPVSPLSLHHPASISFLASLPASSLLLPSRFRTGSSRKGVQQPVAWSRWCMLSPSSASCCCYLIRARGEEPGVEVLSDSVIHKSGDGSFSGN